LVEDQDGVRSFTKAVLTEYGYHVLEASGGEQALAVAGRYPEEIHLLLTDVVLTGMNGKVLSEMLKKLRPNLRTVFVSGYTANVISERGVLDHGAVFLQKPFSPDELAAKVREALGDLIQ
jgi:DNA-binding response OmpR family regulator